MEILAMRRQEADDLKFSIDAKIEEWDTIKTIDEAVKEAGAATDESAGQYKMYKESVRQMESEIMQYTANVEMFDIKMKPILERASIEKQASEDEGMKLIEEYRNQKAPDFKKLAEPVIA
jgi:hypothetical protein